MLRHNHYERAFEGFLRDKRMPYVAVDESKKALFAGSRLKSFDFVVYSKTGPNLLVDVKGRKAKDNASLQTWATRRDVEDLYQWERVFGDGFVAMLAYAFEIDPVLTPPPGHFRLVWQDQERHYLLLGIVLRDYRDAMTERSARWDTVTVNAGDFRQLAKPMEAWL
ncbi:MAG: HYExAFE family protein [Planctomycetota bacterium]